MSMTEQFNVQPAPQRKVLGIEFGSTRIKAVLTDGHGAVLATGSHTWENQLVNGIWIYPLEQVWNGLQACYRDMATGTGCGTAVRSPFWMQSASAA